MDASVAGGVFLVAYAVIASERFDRTLVALLGGLLVVALGVIPQATAFEAIDLNVIFLLAGMMVLAGGIGRSGFFEWVALRSVVLSQGRPFRLLVMLSLATAVLSAFLDNVTTVVLVAPVTLSMARALGLSPIPFLISEILASNIGGTATLIGDPPNILIGSAAGLDFTAFVVHLAPVAALVLVAFLVTMRIVFSGALHIAEDRRASLLAVDASASIADRRLLARGLVVLGFTLAGFLLHEALGLEAATVALLGATVLMLVGPLDPHDALRIDRVVDAVLLRRPVHAGRGDRAGRDRGRHRRGAGVGDRGPARGRHARPPLVLGDRVRGGRQHPLHGDRDSDRLPARRRTA